MSTIRKRDMQRNNRSGCPGVHFKVAAQKWIAVIQVGNRRHNLGCFHSFNEAVKARRAAERRFGKSGAA
jgi:hypothetical protein